MGGASTSFDARQQIAAAKGNMADVGLVNGSCITGLVMGFDEHGKVRILPIDSGALFNTTPQMVRSVRLRTDLEKPTIPAYFAVDLEAASMNAGSTTAAPTKRG